ncbi:MAG: hypothetical protein WCK87_03245 [Candidatus Saccharibacteria bacterium]
MAVKKPTSKTPAKSRTGSSKSKLNSLPKVNKWLALLFVAVIAGVGAYIIFRANAATNNCQAVGAVQICDVDMALGNDTTVLSTTGWADSLGKAGFWYFGAVFRAPTTAYAGAVPISAVFNESTTYRDYMTVAQKSLKDSAFPGKTRDEGVAFYAWENPGQPDTVPVYRITQGGSTTKTFYSTDLGTINRLLAESQNDPNGWKRDQFAGSSFIAFYAYPPNYKVAAQPNPYDCSILANYVSDRCSGSRAALDTAVAAGNVPVGNGCPATLEIYRKAPFASQFDQACQDKWNTYMNDCTVQENLVSDRCKNERQAQADAQAEQARLRTAAAAPVVPATPSFKSGGGGAVIANTVPACGPKCKRDNELRAAFFAGNVQRDAEIAQANADQAAADAAAQKQADLDRTLKKCNAFYKGKGFITWFGFLSEEACLDRVQNYDMNQLQPYQKTTQRNYYYGSAMIYTGYARRAR